VATWLELVKKFAPTIIELAVPGGAVLGPVIEQGIIEAEGLTGANGAAKKAHVLALVALSVIAVNAAKGAVVLDPVAVNAAAASAIDTTISVVNLVHAAHANEAL